MSPLAATGLPIHRRFVPDDVGGGGHDLFCSMGAIVTPQLAWV